MNGFIPVLLRIYSRLLLLYPHRFYDEFAEEMQIVFRDAVREAVEEGVLSILLVCLRELIGLPFNVLLEFWHEVKRKDTNMATNEKVEPKSVTDGGASHWIALISALPFALFGIVSILAKFDLFFHGTYSYLNDLYLYLAAYIIVLIGLFIGLVKGAPPWTYSYLGWSLIFFWMSYWFLGAVTNHELGPWSWQTWSPLLATFAAALIVTRSLNPLFQLVRGVWQDWTLLSLVIYTFVGFMMLDYDENHSPYLVAFIIASTFAISASVWVFMRNTKPLYRFTTLVSGFVAGMIINRISESTWDVAAYYGLHSSPPVPWYDSILDVIVMTGFWGVIMLLPVVVGVVRSIINKEITT